MANLDIVHNQSSALCSIQIPFLVPLLLIDFLIQLPIRFRVVHILQGGVLFVVEGAKTYLWMDGIR